MQKIDCLQCEQMHNKTDSFNRDIWNRSPPASDRQFYRAVNRKETVLQSIRPVLRSPTMYKEG